MTSKDIQGHPRTSKDIQGHPMTSNDIHDIDDIHDINDIHDKVSKDLIWSNQYNRIKYICFKVEGQTKLPEEVASNQTQVANQVEPSSG